MNVLVIGKNGQLAWELQQTAPADVALTALGRDEMDVSDAAAVRRCLHDHQPDLVMNCSAYTAVDKAESEVQAAYAVNELGAKNLALCCKEFGIRLLHVSTDFVFDGTQATPYNPDDQPNPVSVYGASKLAGERAILDILEDGVIVRTAWVYSVNGNNFVKTMLRLMTERPHLGVVYDQVGTPTWAKGLAQWMWCVAQKPEVKGIYHWSDAGVASWYDFALAIQELAVARGLLDREVPVKPIPAVQYPTPARRPSFSVLDKSSAEQATGIAPTHWRKQLGAMLDELASKA
jgi:dTDP-4-dehydrorhamnose reductase